MDTCKTIIICGIGECNSDCCEKYAKQRAIEEIRKFRDWLKIKKMDFMGIDRAISIYEKEINKT